MKKQTTTKLAVVVFVLGVSGAIPAGRCASADPFVGSRTLRLYGDSNISDGFTVGGSHTVDFVIYTNDGTNYCLAAHGGSLSLAMIRSGNQLSLSPRPQGTAVDAYMLSDGVAGAFVLVGQEIDDPTDISVSLATWVQDTTVTGSQIAGDWFMTEIEDTNIGNPHSPFSKAQKTLSIVDVGDGLVDVHYPVSSTESVTWRMKIVDNVLVALPETLEPFPFMAHLVMKTDGYGLAMAAVGVEAWDATDISVSIGFASRGRPSSPPNIVGTWTGQAELASAEGYRTVEISMAIRDQREALFRGTLTVGEPFGGGMPISGIGVRDTFRMSGDGIVGEFTVCRPETADDARKVVGHWHSVIRADDEGPIYLHTAKFELEEI